MSCSTISLLIPFFILTILGHVSAQGLSTSIHSSGALCPYQTFRNTLTFDPPTVGGSCRCPTFNAGVSFSVDRGLFLCVEKCFQKLSNTECTKSMRKTSADVFSSCCNTCSGLIDPTKKYHDLRHGRNGTNFGCAASYTSPSPTPVSCPYGTFSNRHSFDKNIIGGYCRCKNLFGDRFTPGVSFPVSPSLFSCTSKCFESLAKTECKRDMQEVSKNKMKKCCGQCGGSPKEMTFFEFRRKLVNKGFGCDAPIPWNLEPSGATPSVNAMYV